MYAHTGNKQNKSKELQKKKQNIGAVRLKQTQFVYACVQQEMPVKKEEEAWLLGDPPPTPSPQLRGLQG